MTLRNVLILAGASALLAACNSGDTPADDATADAPLPELTSAPVPTAAPDGTALAPGSWQVSEDASGASASFGVPNVDPALRITCDTATRAVMLTRQDSTGAPASPKNYAVEAGGNAARLEMLPAADGSAALVAEIDPTQPVFTAFSAADTAIAFTSEDGVKTQYPTHPGIQRVLYACL